MQTRVDKRISFGKIAYNGGPRKINDVAVEIAIYYQDDGKKQFTASGAIWNGAHTDYVMGGQVLDKINEYRSLLNNPQLFSEIYFYWKKYHLKNTPEYIVVRVEQMLEGDFTPTEESRRAQIMAVFEYGV